jgi:hypothetical protein
VSSGLTTKLSDPARETRAPARDSSVNAKIFAAEQVFDCRTRVKLNAFWRPSVALSNSVGSTHCVNMKNEMNCASVRPTEVVKAWVDQTDVSYADSVTASKKVSYADPTEVCGSDPIKAEHVDPFDVSYADFDMDNYADRDKLSYSPSLDAPEMSRRVSAPWRIVSTPIVLKACQRVMLRVLANVLNHRSS